MFTMDVLIIAPEETSFTEVILTDISSVLICYSHIITH